MDLNAFTIPELKGILNVASVGYSSRLRKQEFIDLINSIVFIGMPGPPEPSNPTTELKRLDDKWSHPKDKDVEAKLYKLDPPKPPAQPAKPKKVRDLERKRNNLTNQLKRNPNDKRKRKELRHVENQLSKLRDDQPKPPKFTSKKATKKALRNKSRKPKPRAYPREPELPPPTISEIFHGRFSTRYRVTRNLNSNLSNLILGMILPMIQTRTWVAYFFESNVYRNQGVSRYAGMINSSAFATLREITEFINRCETEDWI